MEDYYYVYSMTFVNNCHYNQPEYRQLSVKMGMWHEASIRVCMTEHATVRYDANVYYYCIASFFFRDGIIVE